jgi:hypothetical protein
MQVPGVHIGKKQKITTATNPHQYQSLGKTNFFLPESL